MKICEQPLKLYYKIWLPFLWTQYIRIAVFVEVWLDLYVESSVRDMYHALVFTVITMLNTLGNSNNNNKKKKKNKNNNVL